MSNKIHITENQVLSVIDKVLRENRKVIKVGNAQPPMPPMPEEDPAMAAGQMGPVDPAGEQAGAPMDASMDANGQMPDDGASSQFDTNFDAGVEADEETDPKHYIQQLTGKLSQTLNSFNSEQGPDAGLSKYVASMIISAACKNLDEKAKKELIEKINSSSSDEPEEEPVDEPTDGGEEMPMDDMGEEPGMDDMQQPVNEAKYTKKALMELMGVCTDERRPKEVSSKKVPKETPKAWKGKTQINGSKK